MSRIKPVGYAAIIDRRVREVWEPNDDAEFRLWWTEQVLAAKPEPVAFSPLYTADQILAAIEALRRKIQDTPSGSCQHFADIGWNAAIDALRSCLGLEEAK